MGFAIVSAVFGGVVIICYSISIAMFMYRRDNYWYNDYYYHYEMAVTAITLVLGVVEFGIGI